MMAEGLTQREVQIMSLISKGKKSSEISSCLSISKLTVDTHLKNIRTKLEVENTVQAVTIAIVRGWITP